MRLDVLTSVDIELVHVKCQRSLTIVLAELLQMPGKVFLINGLLVEVVLLEATLSTHSHDNGPIPLVYLLLVDA